MKLIWVKSMSQRRTKNFSFQLITGNMYHLARLGLVLNFQIWTLLDSTFNPLDHNFCDSSPQTNLTKSTLKNFKLPRTLIMKVLIRVGRTRSWVRNQIEIFRDSDMGLEKIKTSYSESESQTQVTQLWYGYWIIPSKR